MVLRSTACTAVSLCSVRYSSARFKWTCLFFTMAKVVPMCGRTQEVRIELQRSPGPVLLFVAKTVDNCPRSDSIRSLQGGINSSGTCSGCFNAETSNLPRSVPQRQRKKHIYTFLYVGSGMHVNRFGLGIPTVKGQGRLRRA